MTTYGYVATTHAGQRLRTITNPLGFTHTYQYNSGNFVEANINPLGEYNHRRLERGRENRRHRRVRISDQLRLCQRRTIVVGHQRRGASNDLLLFRRFAQPGRRRGSTGVPNDSELRHRRQDRGCPGRPGLHHLGDPRRHESRHGCRGPARASHQLHLRPEWQPHVGDRRARLHDHFRLRRQWQDNCSSQRPGKPLHPDLWRDRTAGRFRQPARFSNHRFSRRARSSHGDHPTQWRTNVLHLRHRRTASCHRDDRRGANHVGL